MKPFSGLLSPAETSELIRQGRALIISGTAELLSQLPSGNWIGGTTPYAMTRQGAGQFPDRLFVQSLGLAVARIRAYDREELPGFLYDAPEHGLSVLILPSASDILEVYAQQAPDYPEMYLKPVVGWVAGVPLEQLGRAPALTFDGSTGRQFSDQAVVLHHALEPGRQVDIDIINPFEPGEGPAVRFEQTGFQVESCLVDGQPANFARFIEQQGIDPRWPLVADYCGAMINVSIQKVEADRVQFYAPVFAGVEYRFARPIEHFRERFLAELSEQREEPLFGCNCILNYLHAGLEGSCTAALTGPIAFGEIAWQLLNQTVVLVRPVE